MLGVRDLDGGVAEQAAAQREIAVRRHEQRQQPFHRGQVGALEGQLVAEDLVVLETPQAGLDQLVLGAEVLVERALGDVGRLGELGEPGRVDAVAVEEVGCGLEDPLPRAGSSTRSSPSHNPSADLFLGVAHPGGGNLSPFTASARG
ncbi:hypothetical protein Aco04nite_50390 [Winogradskya consettensis]|uniref:Uncharacterized protein n=1 Tax=Winogradskya consettensis TaxID=113560 RepID=A0A919SRU9_9ACTN|nr:hypothetical protein Aco04nite_50390 [Actinoplanes consettensis]